MRVNHCGEVCAQALYQGQALASDNAALKRALEQAAREEEDHLAWAEERIAELGGRTSLLNPLWYAGSLAIGFAAGKLGDAWNLGFLKETERQVERHLQGHSRPAEPGRHPHPRGGCGHAARRSRARPHGGSARRAGAAAAGEGCDGGGGEGDDDGVVPGLTRLGEQSPPAGKEIGRSRAADFAPSGLFQKLNRTWTPRMFTFAL